MKCDVNVTPQEKALELVNKFKPFVSKFDIALAKQAALIAVCEIDSAIDFDWMEVQNLEREHKYWENVENEINKL